MCRLAKVRVVRLRRLEGIVDIALQDQAVDRDRGAVRGDPHGFQVGLRGHDRLGGWRVAPTVAEWEIAIDPEGQPSIDMGKGQVVGSWPGDSRRCGGTQSVCTMEQPGSPGGQVDVASMRTAAPDQVQPQAPGRLMDGQTQRDGQVADPVRLEPGSRGARGSLRSRAARSVLYDV